MSQLFVTACLSSLADGYRQDCSGMVSMAWQSSTSGGGHTTYNMQVRCCQKYASREYGYHHMQMLS
jgi:hypothetical protein